MPVLLARQSPPHALASAVADMSSAVEAAGQIELAKSIAKHLRPLGHEVALWRQAIVLLQSRLAKNRLPESTAAFVRQWMPSADSPPELPAKFRLLLGRSESGILRLHSASVSFAANPGWWALLQLPALKDHWAAALRASHFEHLLTILPGAWMMDDAPMVPGTVIHGLDIGGWDKLDSLNTTGRTFSQANEGLLVEEFEPAEWWLAGYARDGNSVELTGIQQAVLTEDVWKILRAPVA